MRLFIGPLAEAVTQQDVRDFIESGIRPTGPLAFLRRIKARVSCTMMEVPDRDGRATIYFAIAHVHPTSLVGKVIAQLNGAAIRGGPVTVRKYLERNPGNERRRGSPSIRLKERRRDADRRGHALRRVQGATKELVFSAVKEFAREHKEP